MVNPLQFDVFLAHNSQDKPLVRAIARELKQRRLKYWIDEEQIPPGRAFQDVIQLAIPNVKSAAIFIGLGGLGRWQAMELRTLISRCVDADIPVIPVLLPGVEKIPEHLLFLKELNWVQFASRIDDIEALDYLEWGITGRKPKPTSPRQSLKDEFNPERKLLNSTRLEELPAARNHLEANHKVKNQPMLENRPMLVQPNKAIEIFLCYSGTHKDKKLRNALKKRLSGLIQQGIITCWHDGEVGAGKNEEHEIKLHLNAARLILLLISPDFMDWYYNDDFQVKRAMERYKAGEASVIPILLQQVDWSGTEFSKLRPLPSNGEFVDSRYWKNQNEALFSITKDIRIEIEKIATN